MTIRTIGPLCALLSALCLSTAYGCTSDDDDELGNGGNAGSSAAGAGSGGKAGAGQGGGGQGGAGGAGQGGGGSGGGGGQTLGSIINADGELDAFGGALGSADIDTQALFNVATARTVFAPTNEAFQQLGDACVLALSGDEATMSQLIRYHVVDGALGSSAIPDGDTTKATLLANASVKISKGGSIVTLNDEAEVVTADVLASNGVLHKIDRVLIPTVAGFTLPEDCNAALTAGVLR
ncbi:MAG: fasciclin domain-containing protein [Polyangiaceae bacterium]|nr:fasciclin domain-containing protein [Polyangiaceae bacterium]